MHELIGKVAIVTGCGNPNGMGRATALKLAELGATVVVTDICRSDKELEIDGMMKLGDDMFSLEELVNALNQKAGQGYAMALDLLNAKQIKNVVSHVIEQYGHIDILVNNAGAGVGAGPFLDTDVAGWKLSYDVNVVGPMELCQHVIPQMQKQNSGSIINNASIAGISGLPMYGAYAATKHAVVGLTKLIAAEFAEQGIRCNAVCPGSIHTDMGESEALMLSSLYNITKEEALVKLGEEAAMKRMGQPEELANVIAFLASEESSYITGVAIPVTGGMRPGL